MLSKSNKGRTHQIHKHKIVYIIPTYNEVENIERMITKVGDVLDSLSKYTTNILVVDDKSPDGTGKVVKNLQKNNPDIILLSGFKKGLGKAMSRGIEYAINKLRADIVITNEADFSYSPSLVPTMINKIENGADAVFGSRKLGSVDKWSLSRKAMHFFANTFFAKYVAGIDEIEDHNSAFRAIRVRGILDKIRFTNFPKGYAFFNYLTFKISLITSKFVEIKTNFHPRKVGESKVSFRFGNFKHLIDEVLEYIFTCIRIRIEDTFL